MIRRLAGLGTLLALLLFCPSPLNADLNDFYYKIIKIAFTNGYVEAVASDLQRITSLKEDRNALKRAVEMEAEKYMLRVVDLNQTLPGGEKPTKSGKAFESTRWW